MEFLKIIGMCLIAAGAAVMLNQYKKEYAAAISVGLGCMILLAVLSAVLPAFSVISGYLDSAGVNGKYFLTAVKAVAIGYLSQFAADTCRDFGQSAIAAKAELAGKTAIFLLSVPILRDLFEIITKTV